MLLQPQAFSILFFLHPVFDAFDKDGVKHKRETLE